MDDKTYQRLLGFCLNYVSIHPRSVHEIRSYIEKKIAQWKVSPALLDTVMNRLIELGYADDVKFVGLYIESMNRSRPKGRMLIRMELQRKGVSRDSIGLALEGLKNDELHTELDLARNTATKKLRSLKRYDKTSQRTKIYSFLVRRGFDTKTISLVIDEMFPKGLQYDE
jgi:regulatory protein